VTTQRQFATGVRAIGERAVLRSKIRWADSKDLYFYGQEIKNRLSTPQVTHHNTPVRRASQQRTFTARKKKNFGESMPAPDLQ